MKPVAIDLFCGKGGWTNGLLEAGFKVYGFDIEPQPDYKGIFVQCDILALTADDLRKYGASFATCSSPCEQFSVHGLKCFHPNPKFPDMGLRLFNHGKSLLEELEIPYVMENVRSAEKFVGKAVNHYGPFYLWGNAVPAIVTPDCYKLTKGTKFGLDKDGTRNGRKLHDRYYQTGSRSKGRTEHIASVAMIPLPIALAVAETAWNLTQLDNNY